MEREDVRKRKERSDKKRDIRPTIQSELYDFVSDLSYITNRPMKEIGETICMEGIRSKKIIDHISQHLRRPYMHGDTLFNGFLDREPYKLTKDPRIVKKRLTMRFVSEEYEHFSSLSYCLDTTVSACAELILSTAVKDTDIINQYVLDNVNYTLDENRKRVLKSIYRYVSKDNPFHTTVSLMEIIKMIFKKLFEK